MIKANKANSNMVSGLQAGISLCRLCADALLLLKIIDVCTSNILKTITKTDRFWV